MSAQITDPRAAHTFALAGKAVITITSTRTARSYTYKISRAKNSTDDYFVALLTGPDNTSDFTYLGMHRVGVANSLILTRASRMTADSLPCRAIKFFFDQVRYGQIPAGLEIRHEGKCGRCSRALTVPESIDRGIGPECADQMGLA